MRILVLFISVLLSQNVTASTLKLDYSLFFGYMKTMYKLDYQHVTTGFYLVEQATGEVCGIDQAEIVVDTKRETIAFGRQGQLSPFYSDEHRKDGAMIEVKTVENMVCALQVAIMAKESELVNISFEKLGLITTELEGVLLKNAGMIGKYFLPTYSGLRFKLTQPISAEMQLPEGYVIASNGDLLIPNAVVNSTDPSEILHYEITRITPWIGK